MIKQKLRCYSLFFIPDILIREDEGPILASSSIDAYTNNWMERFGNLKVLNVLVSNPSFTIYTAKVDPQKETKKNKGESSKIQSRYIFISLNQDGITTILS